MSYPWVVERRLLREALDEADEYRRRQSFGPAARVVERFVDELSARLRDWLHRSERAPFGPDNEAFAVFFASTRLDDLRSALCMLQAIHELERSTVKHSDSRRVLTASDEHRSNGRVRKR